MLSVSDDGIVVLAGILQLFPIKNLWFWFLGGCASVLAYLVTTKAENRRIAVAIGVFGASLFVLFIVGGVSRDLWGINLPDWAYAILGFLSNPIIKRFLANTDIIVDALFDKILTRLGVENKDKENENL